MTNTKRVTLLTANQRERLFVKLRAANLYPLAEIAPLLGVSIQEARDLDKALREEVLLERAMIEIKNTLNNGY